ncbi:MAG: LysR family transcriptional regulator [Clostridia bacterium]|nr:LysR family transcriptional regulator [Clostridia bacterium]
MNLNQLEYFVCAAETLNFTKAAEKCFISQTAMTQQIKALENTVGVALFDRDNHHVSLTTAGKVYLNEARVILNRSNHALRIARLASDGLTGDIRIGYVRGYGHNDLRDFLKNFHNGYPGVNLHLIRDNTEALMEEIHNENCDLAFSVMPSLQENMKEDRNYLFLQSYPLMVVVYDNHPLANREALIYKELEGETFIWMDSSHYEEKLEQELASSQGKGSYYAKKLDVESDPETLLLRISVGLGISILPEFVLQTYRQTSNVRAIPLLKEDGTVETVDFHAVWAKENNNPVLGNLIEMLKEMS